LQHDKVYLDKHTHTHTHTKLREQVRWRRIFS